MKPVILCVLDGYGIAPASTGNAIEQANPAYIHNLIKNYPHTYLAASGEAVGLPRNEAGNTEVGHINMGAGRVVLQDLPKINTSIAKGAFYNIKVFKQAFSHIKKTKGNIHIIGLIGQYHVHASIDHLFALLSMAKQQKCKNVYIHVITDGRDSPPKTAEKYFKKLDSFINRHTVGVIASISGRFYAMDRDHRWERTEKAYNMLTRGIGSKAHTWKEVLKVHYEEGKSDEFINPTNITGDDNEIQLIKEGDSVIFYNFRIDRPRQLTKAFVLENFERDANIVSYDPHAEKYDKSHVSHQTRIFNPPFKRDKKIQNLFFVTMTEYEKNLPIHVAYPTQLVKHPLSEVLSNSGIHQLKVTESEKERFVTTYFNGLHETIFLNEDRIIIPSPHVLTYDLKPEMSATRITDTLISSIKTHKYSFILVNYPNADMVGHTGNMSACINAIKTLDTCMKRLVTETLREDYTCIITADHGNAEQMIHAKTHEVSTEHSTNLVPFIMVDNRYYKKAIKLKTGILADVAPTILSLLGIKKPKVMNGKNLLTKQ